MSNLDVSTTSNTLYTLGSYAASTGFIAGGTATHGYYIKNVKAWLYLSSALTSEENGKVRAELWSNSDNASLRPWSKVADLTVPSSLSSGFVTFGGNDTVLQNGTYHVVIYAEGGVGKLGAYVLNEGENDETGASGWSILNHANIYSTTEPGVGGQWFKYNRPMKIAVEGWARTRLAAPANVVRTPGSGEITVSWDAVEYADRYVIEYGVAGSGQASKITVNGATTRTITGLTNGSAYAMRVQAQNSEKKHVDGTWSAWRQATPQVAPPGRPVGLGVTPGATQLALEWTAPSGPPSSYDVHYTSSTSVANEAAVGSTVASQWVAVSGSVTSASHTITGLTNNTAYRVRVRGVNTAGSGPWAFGTGTPVATSSGSTDASLSALVVKNANEEVVTIAPVFASTTYAYTADVAAAEGEVTVTPTLNESNATVKVNGTTVTSGSASGDIELDYGENTVTVEVTAQAGNTRNYTITLNRPLPVLKWPSANTSQAEGATFQIRLEPFASNDMSGTLTYAPGATHPASLHDDVGAGNGRTTQISMSKGDQYPSVINIRLVEDALNEEHETFTITIEPGTGYRVGSPRTVTVTITDNDPPAAPASLSVSPAGSGKLEALWRKPDGPVTGYQLRWKQASAADQAATTAGDPSTGWVEGDATTSLTQDITGLTDGTAYHVQVRATDGQSGTGNGYGEWTESKTGVPNTRAAPTGLSATPGGGKVTLSWTRLTGLTFFTSRYEIQYGETPDGELNRRLTGRLSTSTSSFAITGLTPGVEYRFRVRLDRLSGQGVPHGAWSDWVTATPISPTDPPTDLVVTASAGELALSWTAPTGETLTGYDVHYTSSTTVAADHPGGSNNDASRNWKAIPRGTEASPPATGQTITGLTNNRTYRVRVRAKGAAGDSAWLHGTGTPSVNPPTGLAVVEASRELRLSWTAPSDVTVTGYDIHYTRAPKTGNGAVADDAAAHGRVSTTHWVALLSGQRSATDTSTSHTIDGLTNNIEYRVRVRGKYAGGTTGWVFGAGTPAAREPTGLTVRSRLGGLDVSWTAPAGATPTAYHVDYTSAPATGNGAVGNNAAAGGTNPANAGTGWVAVGRSNTPATKTSVSITGLTNGTEYRVRLRATYALGRSVWVFGKGTPNGTYGFVRESVTGTPGYPVTVSVKLSDAAPAGGLALTLTRLLGTSVPSGICTSPGTPAEADDIGSSPPGTVTVAANATTATASFPLADNGDDLVGGSECFALRLGDSASDWVAGDKDVVEMKIERPNARIAFGGDAASTTKYTATVAETVTSGTLDVPVTVDSLPNESTRFTVRVRAAGTATEYVDASNPNDFRIQSKDVTFGPATAKTQNVTVTITNDREVEADETIELSLARTSDALATVYHLHAQGSTATVTITSEDAVPGAVTGLGVAADDGELTVTWQAPASAGSSAITGYDVHYTSADAATVANDAAVQTGATPLAVTGWVDAGHTGTTALSQAITGLANDDAHRVRVRAVNGLGAGPWAQGSGTPAATPSVSLSASPNPVGEGSDVTITATLSKPLSADVTIPVTVSDGTADAGDRGTLTGIAITGGATTGTGTVTTAHDADADEETFTVALDTDSLPATVTAGTPSSVEVTISDDEKPSVSLSASPNPVDEGSDVTITATLTAVLSTDVTIPLTVTHGTAETTDYGTLASITVTAGQTSGTGAVSTNQDSGEDDETFTVALDTANLPAAVTAGSPSSVEVTISDDEGTPAVSLSASPNPVPEGSNVTVTATLSKVLASDLTIPLTLTPGTAEAGDYGALSGITFTAGQTTATGTIRANHDADAFNETFTVSLGTLPAGVRAGSPSSVEVTIGDDDAATVTLAAAPNPVTEGRGVTVTARLHRTLTSDVTLPVTLTRGTAESGDYGALASITIAAGRTSATGTITTAHDADTDDETFTVALDTANLPAIVAAGAATSVAVTIDDDDATVTLSAAPNPVKEGGSVTVTATLSGPATRSVTVPVTVTPGTAEAEDLGTLTGIRIAAGRTSGTGRIEARQDDDIDDETFTVAVDTANLPATVVAGATTSVAVTIDDDDTPTVSLSVSPRHPVKAGESVTITATLSAALRSDVTIPLKLTPDPGTTSGDYGTLSSIRIAAGARSGSGTITTRRDSDEDYESFKVALDTANLPAAVQAGRLWVRVRIAPRKIPIVWLTAPDTVNEGGTATVTARLTVAMDPAAAVTIPLTARFVDGSTQSTGATIAAGATSGTHGIVTEKDDDSYHGTLIVEIDTRRLPHDVRIARLSSQYPTSVAITIRDTDPSPTQNWLSRFGRAAASNAMDAVTGRMETPRAASSYLTLAGQRIDFSGDGAALAAMLTGFAQTFGAPGAPAASDDDPGSGAGAGSFARHGLGLWNDPVSAPARRVTVRELMLGTSFRAVLGQGAGSQFTSWGQGASVSRFSGGGPGLDLTGEAATGSLGMDYERGNLLAGFAMTHTLGEGTARSAGPTYLMGSEVTTALPYARLALSERVSAWGFAGTGSGALTLGNDDEAARRHRADLSMMLAGAGVRGDLVTPAEPGGFTLALKADAFWVRTEADRISVPGVGYLAAARADASRVRAVLDGSRTFSLAGGGALTPSVELGVRNDGGDAETGTGLELGVGLGYADPSRGLDMALRMHGIAAHANEGYREWGVSGQLRLVPGGAGRGLSASLTPSYGVPPGGCARLWALPDASGMAANDDAALAGRLDAELGYGMPVFGDRFTGTPNVGFGLSEAAREYRMGWRLTSAVPNDPGFEVSIDGTRRESANDNEAEHGIMLKSMVRW